MSRVGAALACAAMNRSSVTRVSLRDSARPMRLLPAIDSGVDADDGVVQEREDAGVQLVDVGIDRLDGLVREARGGDVLQPILRRHGGAILDAGGAEAARD